MAHQPDPGHRATAFGPRAWQHLATGGFGSIWCQGALPTPRLGALAMPQPGGRRKWWQQQRQWLRPIASLSQALSQVILAHSLKTWTSINLMIRGAPRQVRDVDLNVLRQTAELLQVSYSLIGYFSHCFILKAVLDSWRKGLEHLFSSNVNYEQKGMPAPCQVSHLNLVERELRHTPVLNISFRWCSMVAHLIPDFRGLPVQHMGCWESHSEASNCPQVLC